MFLNLNLILSKFKSTKVVKVNHPNSGLLIMMGRMLTNVAEQEGGSTWPSSTQSRLLATSVPRFLGGGSDQCLARRGARLAKSSIPD